jgi:hypothetical protein
VREQSKHSALILFCTVLAAIVALVALLSPLPFVQALSAGALLVASVFVLVRRVSATEALREDLWSLGGLAVALLGLIALLVISEDPVPGPSKFGGPRVLPTVKGNFRAKAGPNGAVALSEPTRTAKVVTHYDPGTEISFEGFCLGEPTNDEPPFDFRWFVISGGSYLVPGPFIAGDPPPGSSPRACPESSYEPDATEISLDVGYAYEFLDGIRDPTEPDAIYPYVLGVAQNAVGQVGFAGELNDSGADPDRWVNLGISTKLAPIYAFVLYLPDGIIEGGLDPDRPVHVLATPCFAPGQPGLAAATATLILSDSRPVLEDERMLPLGAAAEARAAACTPVVNTLLG